MLKVGDTVLWRGSWGSDLPLLAVIEKIEIECVGKEGESVEEVPWDKVDKSVIVNLDTGNWAYGDAIAKSDTTGVGFDFIMDTFVSVQAPRGTDPETLIEQAIEKFKKRLTDGHAVVVFDGVFED